MSDGRAIYEIRIGYQGTVTTTLQREGVNQDASCAQILNLVRNLGEVDQHDERCGEPQPVNVHLPGLPGPGGN